MLAAARRVLGPGARFGAAPSRFAAYAAALQARPRRGRRAHVVEESGVRDFLAPLPVALLRTRPELQALPDVFERLGIRTLGEVAALPSRAVAERFGHPGLLAHDLARGRDFPLEPRRPPEPVSERLDLPEAASGQQLERALELLVARVLARRERRGRSLRALAVSARFVAGGTWRIAITLRHASADSERILLALGPKLAELPAPAESLALEVEAFGPPAHDQGRLLDEGAAVRRGRLGEAVRQARQAAGSEAALKVLEVDPELAHPRAARGAGAVPGRPVNPGGSRRLGAPEPAAVAADDRGVPAPVGRAPVDSVREEWVVEDRWWTGRPLRRRYFELVLENGRNVVVFRDLVGGGWFVQRA